MRPDFAERVPKGGRTQQVGVSVPEPWVGELKRYADIEGDSVNGLIREGIMRVLDDRNADPRYAQAIATAAEVESLEAQLADAQTRLNQLLHPPQPTE